MFRYFSKYLTFLYLGTVSCFAMSSSVEPISSTQLLAADKQQWLILDVRTQEEYDSEHIPGAINISHDELENKLNNILAYKDKPVVVYCRSGRRASIATQVLVDNGFSQVKHLAGDMIGWRLSGHETEE